MRRLLRYLPLFGILALTSLTAAGDEPLRSGLQPGTRPGPYAAIYVTGPNRGVSHCYICETGDKPAVIILARSLSDPLGKLARQIDKALGGKGNPDLRGWMTVMAEDHVPLDAKINAWAKKHALAALPIGVFEDRDGPPSYKLAPGADVTVLLSVKQKVVANFSMRAGELTEDRMAEIMKMVPQLGKEP